MLRDLISSCRFSSFVYLPEIKDGILTVTGIVVRMMRPIQLLQLIWFSCGMLKTSVIFAKCGSGSVIQAFVAIVPTCCCHEIQYKPIFTKINKDGEALKRRGSATA